MTLSWYSQTQEKVFWMLVQAYTLDVPTLSLENRTDILKTISLKVDLGLFFALSNYKVKKVYISKVYIQLKVNDVYIRLSIYKVRRLNIQTTGRLSRTYIQSLKFSCR